MSVTICLHALIEGGDFNIDDVKVFCSNWLGSRWCGYHYGDPEDYDCNKMVAEFGGFDNLYQLIETPIMMTPLQSQYYEIMQRPSEYRSDELCSKVANSPKYVLWSTDGGDLPQWIQTICDKVVDSFPVLTEILRTQIVQVSEEPKLEEWLDLNMGNRLFIISW